MEQVLLTKGALQKETQPPVFPMLDVDVLKKAAAPHPMAAKMFLVSEKWNGESVRFNPDET